jgi:hypothetical protein
MRTTGGRGERKTFSPLFLNVWDALFEDTGEKAVLEIKSRLMDEIRQYLNLNKIGKKIKAGTFHPRLNHFSISDSEKVLSTYLPWGQREKKDRPPICSISCNIS